MMLAETRQGRINTKSGIALAVAERGDPGGRPLVLLRGYTGICTRTDQERLMAALRGATLVVHEGAGHAPPLGRTQKGRGRHRRLSRADAIAFRRTPPTEKTTWQ